MESRHEGFEWNPGMMCNKSNIKIGNAEYFHPFSAQIIGSLQCWNLFSMQSRC
jgi:hypothetical protein